MAQPVYSDEELFRAAQAADAAGDTEAARKLTQALIAGKTQDQIETLAANLNQTIDKKALAANVASRDAGGPINRVVEKLPTAVQPAATSAINTAVGYGSGAAKAVVDFPLAVAGGVQTGANALLDTVIGGGLDVVGATDAADWWRNTGEVEEARRGALTSPVGTTVNALAPAPAGYETQRNVAEFAGGFLVPGPKGAKAPISAPKTAAQQAARPGVIDNAAQVVAEGNRRSVPVMTTDVKPPKSAMGRWTKQTVPEKIPVVGMSGPRQAQQEARIQAVKDVVDEFGGNSGRNLMDAETAVQDIAQTLGKTRSDRIIALKGAKDSVIDGTQGGVSTPRAVAEIDKQIAELGKLETNEVAPVIARLKDWRSALMGETKQVNTGLLDADGKPIIRAIPPERTLRVIEDLRKLMGETFKDPNLASIRTLGEGALNKIYGPLREDMGAFIQQQAGSAARAKWAKANEELAAMAGELKSSRFKAVLRDTDTTPEAVGRILFSGADNPSDVQRLVANLPPPGRRKVQAALIQRAFDSAGGSEGVSVERFLNNISRNSKTFGIAFEGQDRQTLEGVKRLLEATRRGAEAGANVRTGEQNLPVGVGIAATQMFGLGGGIASLGVGGLLARVYESPMMRDKLLRLASTKPGSVQESRALEVLMRSAAPIVNAWKENATRAVNDNAAGALAASEQEPVEPQ
jgi:hypothetical protein